MNKFDIPQPFDSEEFELFQRGVSDNPSIDVYINELRDFLFLYPTPKTDYGQYVPRVVKYGLTQYKARLQVIKRRFNKIEHLLDDKPHLLLEIGAGDGSFLREIRKNRPQFHLTAVDKDQNTLYQRAMNSDENYHDLAELLEAKKSFDFICLFHVMEHVLSPSEFLTNIRKLMLSTSLLIIETPSFLDPLLSLYNSQAYSKFYFQSQHPYVYSQSSLQRLLEHHGFKTIELINYQRYGLENHLSWLSQCRPGGNEVFQELFKELEIDYIAALERHGSTDTAIWVGRMI